MFRPHHALCLFFVAACSTSSPSVDVTVDVAAHDASSDSAADLSIDTQPDLSGDLAAPDASMFACDPSIGLTQPMTSCSTQLPCNRPLPLYQVTQITEPAEVPVCNTTAFGLGRGRAMHDDNPPKTTTDLDGLTRHWCEYRPTGAARPLVVYVHPSGSNATGLYDYTSLRAKAETETLDPSGPAGFVIISTQARNLHWPTADPQDGSKHDTFHRDLSTNSQNRDVAYLDEIIDSLVNAGAVDPMRIYVTGWSNGARFAAMYGIARHTTATPGGNRVAAVAVYSGGDPFENTQAGASPSCKLATYPTAAIPFMLISRRCDAIACDSQQAAAIESEGGVISPGNIAANWISTLMTTIGANTQWIQLTSVGSVQSGCTPAALCTKTLAITNHIRWPDGHAGGDLLSQDREFDLLTFFRDNPLTP